MQKRSPLPVRQIRIHATNQKRLQHVGLFQQIGLTSRDNRGNPYAGGEKALQKIAFASGAYGGENSTAPPFGRFRILRHESHYFIVLIQPDEVVGIEAPLATARQKK